MTMVRALMGQDPQGDARMSARKRFGHYRREDNRRINRHDVKDDAIRRLMRIWDSFDVSRGDEFMYRTRWIQQHAEELRCSAEDMERFSMAIAQRQDDRFFPERAAAMLSRLIPQAEGDVLTINTRQLEHHNLYGIPSGPPIKSIIVDGDVLSVGQLMRGGRIHVRGSCCCSVGQGMEGGLVVVEGDNDFCDGVGESMKGGRIIIKGDVTGAIGWNMHGGLIMVMGDATGTTINSPWNRAIGTGMDGGEIHLHGSHPGIPENIKGGRIYHRGKLMAGK